MPASEIPQSTRNDSSKNAVSDATDVEDMDDFVIVEPGSYPEPSTHSNTTATNDWTEVIKISQNEDWLCEKIGTTPISC